MPGLRSLEGLIPYLRPYRTAPRRRGPARRDILLEESPEGDANPAGDEALSGTGSGGRLSP